MGRRCGRVGCQHPAAAGVLIDRGSLSVILVDDLDASTRLCAHHAGRLTAPVGWEIVERRARPETPATATLEVSSPLLTRAFHGPAQPAEPRPPRRLAWFERADGPADPEPQPSAEGTPPPSLPARAPSPL